MINVANSLVRALRDLDPVSEPNTTKQIGMEAADLIESLLAEIESMESQLASCE